VSIKTVEGNAGNLHLPDAVLHQNILDAWYTLMKKLKTIEPNVDDS